MIKNVIESIRKDDLLHAFCCMILIKILSILLPFWVAISLTVITAILKEVLWDKILKHGTPEWRDVVSDIIGIIIGVI